MDGTGSMFGVAVATTGARSAVPKSNRTKVRKRRIPPNEMLESIVSSVRTGTKFTEEQRRIQDEAANLLARCPPRFGHQTAPKIGH